jgi:hypothetical protein
MRCAGDKGGPTPRPLLSAALLILGPRLRGDERIAEQAQTNKNPGFRRGFLFRWIAGRFA